MSERGQADFDWAWDAGPSQRNEQLVEGAVVESMTGAAGFKRLSFNYKGS